MGLLDDSDLKTFDSTAPANLGDAGQHNWRRRPEYNMSRASEAAAAASSPPAHS
jgi:hypothetical protein